MGQIRFTEFELQELKKKCSNNAECMYYIMITSSTSPNNYY